MKKLFLLFSISFFLSINLMAQQTVSGVISDSDGNLLPDVTVSVKSKTVEVKTNYAGFYSIEIPEGDAYITFQKSGYQVQSVKINKAIINLVMSKEEIDIFDLSLEELMQVEVISASNVKEKLSDVPATMIIITQTDIQERGYKNLVEMLADLPGMDLSVKNGQLAFNNYWRGFRATYSVPYLFMIDGMVQNETYYSHAAMMRSVPLSNIDKVEIVYGPVSSVYGANAFMGIINVITKKDIKDGLSIVSNTTGSIHGDFIGDYFIGYQKNKFAVKLAARHEYTNTANFIDFDAYEYTASKHYLDTLLWGKDWVNTLANKGKFQFYEKFTNIDFRIDYENTEIGFQFDNKNTHWANSWSSDKLQLATPFDYNTLKTWFKQSFYFNKNFSSHTLLSFRLEDMPESDWLEGYNVTNTGTGNQMIGGDLVEPGKTVRLIDYSYWPGQYKTYTFQQNFEAKIIDNLNMSAGIKYETKNISKQVGYYGAGYTVNNLTSGLADFIPEYTNKYTNLDNIFTWIDYGAYTQLRYSINDNHIVNAGIRVDNNSEYGTSTTFRGGYVGRFDNFGLKALYGQAYQIPTARTLYSTWTKVGSATDLKPENSQTFELQLNYTKKNISTYLSSYYVQNQNTIVSVAGGAKNLGVRDIIGIDFYTSLLIPNLFKKLQIWAYYSTYLKAEEDIFDNNGNKTGVANIGDLSHQKIYFGTTAYFTKNLMLNIRGRYIGERETVSSNPLGKVDAYFVTDMNIMYNNLFVNGFNIGLSVNNLLNTQYFHPGVGLADAGNEPGRWENGVWQGSKGWEASLLPQPHRYFLLTLSMNL